MLITRSKGAVMMPFLVLTLTHPSDAPLRTARATRRDGHWACMGAKKAPLQAIKEQIDVF